MNTAYYESLSKIKAYREQRDEQKEFIYKNPEFLPILNNIACNSNDKNQNKALWIVELICEEQITLYTLYIEDFCNALKTFKGDGIIRPASKICMFLCNSNILLTEVQEEKIIEFCLDRAIDFRKAAPLSYATHALLHLATKHTWIYENLEYIFEKDLPTNTTRGVQFTVKETLKKIHKKKK